MIDIKEACRRAIEYLERLYPDQELDAALEEAELTDDDRYWLVTLSVKRVTPVGGAGESVFGENRTYKIFKLLAETGEVRSMKMRAFK